MQENEQVAAKLDQLVRLTAILATKGLPQRAAITVLNDAGFPPREIAQMLGTSSNTVRVALVRIRRGRKR